MSSIPCKWVFAWRRLMRPLLRFEHSGGHQARMPECFPPCKKCGHGRDDWRNQVCSSDHTYSLLRFRIFIRWAYARAPLSSGEGIPRILAHEQVLHLRYHIPPFWLPGLSGLHSKQMPRERRLSTTGFIKFQKLQCSSQCVAPCCERQTLHLLGGAARFGSFVQVPMFVRAWVPVRDRTVVQNSVLLARLLRMAT